MTEWTSMISPLQFGPQPRVSAPLQNLLETQICEPQAKPGSKGMGPTNLCFVKPSRELVSTLKFETLTQSFQLLRR